MRDDNCYTCAYGVKRREPTRESGTERGDVLCLSGWPLNGNNKPFLSFPAAGCHMHKDRSP